jgi:hypothetical protein
MTQFWCSMGLWSSESVYGPKYLKRSILIRVASPLADLARRLRYYRCCRVAQRARLGESTQESFLYQPTRSGAHNDLDQTRS